MDGISSAPPWHLSSCQILTSPLKELLSQVELPRTTSSYARGSSSDWEQVQFWDQFLRSSTPRSLVENMKTKVLELGTFDMFDEDDYSSIVGAVARYQSGPMGDREHLCDGEDMYALSTLLLSERVYLEGGWDARVPAGHRRSSASRFLWEESAVQLRRRRVSGRTGTGGQAQNVAPTTMTMEQTHITTCVQINAETEASSESDRRAQTKDCYFIAVLAFLVVAGSTTIGVYFSVAEDRMGDGFTVSSYVLAAGTMILGPWVATHYQSCNCRILRSWRRGSMEIDESEIPLVAFARSLTSELMH